VVWSLGENPSFWTDVFFSRAWTNTRSGLPATVCLWLATLSSLIVLFSSKTWARASKPGPPMLRKKKYQEKKKRERVSEGRFFKERKGGSRHVALNVEAGEGLVGPQSLNQGNGSSAVDGAVGHQELGDDGIVGQGLSQPGEDLIVDTPGKKKITRNVSKGKEVEID